MFYTIDTHEFIKRLMKQNFTESQAEELVKVSVDLRKEELNHLSTKSDIKEIKKEIRELELQLIIKLGSMIVVGLIASTTIILMVLPFLIHK
jgi:predicted metalloenzyme YecM